MDQFALKSPEDQQVYFDQAAEESSFSALMLQKDFWVCWALKRLFSLEKIRHSLIFKGGTSLSKAFQLIERFSEDIDLTLHRSFFGFTGEKDPSSTSREKREKLLRELNAHATSYIQGELLESLRSEMARHLPKNVNWKLFPDEDDSDQQTLLFEYPSVKIGDSSYLRQQVKMEFGVRGETEPHQMGKVSPLLTTVNPKVFLDHTVEVPVLNPKRTFWEKATILHAFHYFPEDKRIPERQSRHYYDMYCLLQSFKEEVLKDHQLLTDVVEHKKKFFRAGWANYDLAKRGSLRLSPGERVEKEMEKDYASMEVMFYGDFPKWADILKALAQFETQFNSGESQ